MKSGVKMMDARDSKERDGFWEAYQCNRSIFFAFDFSGSRFWKNKTPPFSKKWGSAFSFHVALHQGFGKAEGIRTGRPNVTEPII